jgi:hypothetical protein
MSSMEAKQYRSEKRVAMAGAYSEVPGCKYPKAHLIP